MGARGFPLTLHSPFPPISAQFAQSNTTVTARRSMRKADLPPEGVTLAALASSSSLSFAQAARISKAAFSVLQRAVREILPTRISQRYRSRVLSCVKTHLPSGRVCQGDRLRNLNYLLQSKKQAASPVGDTPLIPGLSVHY